MATKRGKGLVSFRTVDGKDFLRVLFFYACYILLSLPKGRRWGQPVICVMLAETYRNPIVCSCRTEQSDKILSIVENIGLIMLRPGAYKAFFSYN